MSRPCKSCKGKSLVRDDVTDSLVCSSCGIVQDFDSYEAQIGGISGPQGTFIRVGTVGSGTTYDYKERKVLEAQRLIDDLMVKLGFSGMKSNEIKTMISKITENEYGQGNWFIVLIGACSYVVMRNSEKPLSIAELASVIGCDIHELGRMIKRVVKFLDLKLPEFDIVGSLERAIRNSSSLAGISREKLERMIKQGVFLLQCGIKWFLTTGRRPLPMVAAVLVLVAKLNQVDVKIEDVAKEVNAAVVTCKLRYKELLEALVRAAQALPWGKDVTVKNIITNAPFVIQYMEMKSMAKPVGKRKNLEGVRFDMEVVVSECLRKESDYWNESNDVETDSQYFDLEGRNEFLRSNLDDTDKLNISHECLSMVYSKFQTDVGYLKEMGESGKNQRRQYRSEYEYNACNDWWTGKSALGKKLLLKHILEKDVGLDAMPPSFVSGCMAVEERREKIKAAKLRIERTMHPSNTESNKTDNSVCLQAGRKRRRRPLNILNWEDFIIETLLLHQVNEEEIEKGHYHTLLGLHVFNSGIM